MSLRAITTAGLGLVTALTLAVVPAEASPDRSATSAPERAEATQALDAVERLFAPSSARARKVADGVRPDVTLALRELWRTKGALAPAQRRVAERYLARPVAGELAPDERVINGTIATDCTLATMCVHYTGDGTQDQVTPSYLATVKTVLAEVDGKYASAGYRSPLPDSGQGGNAKLDVYLMDLRPDGMYGYCANDGDLVEGQYTYPVYCVLDNDFVNYALPATESLKVTVAHEYFHAVQGAYDWLEDAWFMEGGAAWAEDEVYTAINDNRQYLADSQLTAPWVPLDLGSNDANVYGPWIFFRYLSERWKAKGGGQPLVMMRKMLERVDASTPAKPDDYSTLAVSNVVQANPKIYPGGLARVYNEFAAANRLPKKYYAEGSAYPTAKPAAFTFGKRTKSIATKTALDKLDHLTSYTSRLTPHKSFKAKKTKLKFSFNLPSRPANPGVTVRTFLKNGKVTTSYVALDKSGGAKKAFGFSAKKVKYLEVTVSNGSVATQCWYSVASPFACYGRPSHDGLRHAFSAKLKR
ncbi:MXAN_6640 family putative metalloprotease [Nocardioides daejeonensis]|uniref:MXAN_6640 family putative metalloprotease n=1 Tax=Nocardioides daejeonensis TaxID=1046556 RepID=UPI000D7496C8|nr:MXAN_6640 family putative metalloprotease [Nocardioides daejeonensis]